MTSGPATKKKGWKRRWCTFNLLVSFLNGNTFPRHSNFLLKNSASWQKGIISVFLPMRNFSPVGYTRPSLCWQIIWAIPTAAGTAIRPHPSSSPDEVWPWSQRNIELCQSKQSYRQFENVWKQVSGVGRILVSWGTKTEEVLRSIAAKQVTMSGTNKKDT